MYAGDSSWESWRDRSRSRLLAAGLPLVVFESRAHWRHFVLHGHLPPTLDGGEFECASLTSTQLRDVLQVLQDDDQGSDEPELQQLQALLRQQIARGLACPRSPLWRGHAASQDWTVSFVEHGPTDDPDDPIWILNCHGRDGSDVQLWWSVRNRVLGGELPGWSKPAIGALKRALANTKLTDGE